MSSQIHFKNLDASRCGLRLAKLSIFAFFFMLFFCAARNAVAAPVAPGISPTWSETAGNEDMAAAVAAFVASGTPTLVGHAEAGNYSSATTAAINTSGATLLVAWLAVEGADPTAPTDNHHNTWQPLPVYANGSHSHGRFFYAYNPAVGPGHTFTAGGRYIALAVSAWSGMLSTSGVYQGSTGAVNVSTKALASGSLSSTGPVLLLTAWAADSQYYQGLAVNQGFNVIGSLTSFMVEEIASHAYLTAGLTGTGTAAVASLSPSNLTFASQAVGNATAPQAITLSNTGNAALSVSSIAITGVSINDFTQTNTCGSSVAAGSNCTISVTFSPTAVGARSAGVTLTDNAAGSPQTVSLAGTGTAAYASPSPSSLSFAGQAIGTHSAAQAVTLTNTGNSALSVYSIAFTGTNSSDFAQANNCGSSLAAGANCTMSVTFTPTASGNRTAAISFTDSAYNSPQTVVLAGTGAAGVLSISPSNLPFGSQLVGSSGAPQSVTLTNSGNAASSTSSFAVSGTNAGSFVQNNNCGSSVAAGGTCTIVVNFSPAASGNLTASLTVVNSATGNPLTVSLSGTGYAVAASLSAPSLVFGSLPVGTTSPAQTVILSNTGTAALSISGVAISGASAGSFSQSNSCGSSLAVGANCQISLTFSPSSTGSLVATLSVADNANGSLQTVSLAGTGTTTASGQTVSVVPSDNLQTLVNEYAASTMFSLAPGMYRLQSVAPQSGDSFVGQTGAILSGATLLTNFVQSGSYWTAQVSVRQQASYPGTCLSTSPVCMYPEDLFFNNVLKTRVASLTNVGPGSWFLDYNAQIAYIGDDPSGQTVEMSELASAFSGGASNVTISNLVVEKYAAPAQSAAIQPYGTGWTVEYSEVRFNHGRGVSTTSGMNVTNNNIHHNGNLGVGGGGSNVTLSDNQISYNNASGYDWAWEAGGAKFAGVTGLTMLSNNSFNNNGPGFWNDISSENVTYTGNQASGNVEAGILIEISDTVTITNNTIVNDGFVAGQSGLYYGAGIVISTSSNVTISGNTITNCMDGISGIYSNRGNNPSGVPYSLSNVVATGNTITQGTGAAMGIVTEGTEIGTTAVYTSMGNNFSGNTFVLTAPSTGMYFYWNNQPMALAAWNSTGH